MQDPKKEDQVTWQRITVTVEKSDAGRAEEVLSVMGSLAISVTDGGEEDQYHLDVPTPPEWSRQVLSGLFPEETDLESVVNAVKSACSHEIQRLKIDSVQDRNWEITSRDQFRPFRVGRRLWICPSWCEPPLDETTLLIDPGLAFGTGTHPTTALCLDYLSRQSLDGLSVLDWGCGSGILALAALKLGARSARGTDVDPRALTTARNNAIINGVDERLEILTPENVPNQFTCDIVIANILAHTLIDLYPRLDQHLRIGGTLLLSGILSSQAERVIDAFPVGYEFTQNEAEGWQLLIGHKTRPSDAVKQQAK
jgi:ribosomal protein L11 methyltransferase